MLTPKKTMIVNDLAYNYITMIDNQISLTENEPISASEFVKRMGLKNLKQVEDITGFTAQKLARWHKSNPDGFAAVVVGVREMTRHDALKDLIVRSVEFIEASSVRLRHLIQLKWDLVEGYRNIGNEKKAVEITAAINAATLACETSDGIGIINSTEQLLRYR